VTADPIRDMEQVMARIEADEALKQRVAALEAVVERLRHPLMIAESPPLSAEDAARFKEEFEAALGDSGHQPLRILPSSLTVLDPETVRQLLRESVTVVQPGEILFFTIGDPNMTPNQMRELQDFINWWLADNAPEVKVLVLPHGEMAAAEAPGHGFMKDVRTDVFRHEHIEAVRLTHLPTGVVAEGATKDEAVAKLGAALIARGDISINDARAALGLPELEMPEASTAQALPSA
jgi:hypothetical protein